MIYSSDFIIHEVTIYSPCPLDLVTLLVPNFSPSLSPGVEAPEDGPVLSPPSPPVIPDSELSMSPAFLIFPLLPSSLLKPRIPLNIKL